MSYWNDLAITNQLEECPVCLVNVAKKRRSKHLYDCTKRHREHMKEVGLLRCPFVQEHIIPRKYLSHHLSSECDGVANHLRIFFDKPDHLDINPNPPSNFLPDVEDSHTRTLLYILRKDLEGNDISNNRDYYP